MNKGQIISGAGHLGLIGWAFLGGFFASRPEAVEFAQVTTISEAEYAAVIRRFETPEVGEEPTAPEQPVSENTSVDIEPEPQDPPVVTPPPQRPEPQPEALPETMPEPLPEQPTASLIDEAPQIETPQDEVAMLLPERSPRPQPRPSQRIAPEPVEPPEPDVRPDDVAQQPVEETPEPVEVAEPEQEETAPEEASTEIVTEAEEQPEPVAPSSSIRPQTRPTRTAEQDTPTPTETAETAPTSNPEPAPEQPTQLQNNQAAVDAALAEALGEASGSDTEAPAGPPMSEGEKDALRVAVQSCWNVGSLSSDALATTVTVAVAMSPDGKPVTNSIHMIASQGGSDGAARQAFEAARRAIIRCGARGFDLPRDKYAHWKEIEMTFNPEKMRIK